MKIDFEKQGGLVPAVIQDAVTMKVLMLGFMNDEALQQTIKEKRVTFFSRTKNRLWTKGETSGNFLEVVDIKNDCDSDSLLITVNPVGPVCHTGEDTCFSEKNINSSNYPFLLELEKIISERKSNPSDSSYTSKLFASGLNLIAQKVGEEAVELVIASLNTDKKRVVEEASDLLFHYLVLLVESGLSLENILEELKARHKAKPTKS